MRAFRRIVSALGLLTAVVVVTSGGAQLAHAAPPEGARAACYDGAVWTPKLTAQESNTFAPSRTGHYTTSSRCRDINFVVVSTSSDDATWSAFTRVCWINHGTCNAWTTVPDDGRFHTIATNVLDGTRFRIEFHWPEPMWGSSWSTQVAY